MKFELNEDDLTLWGEIKKNSNNLNIIDFLKPINASSVFIEEISHPYTFKIEENILIKE